MNNIKAFIVIILLASLAASCLPQTIAVTTATPPQPTKTAIPPTVTLTFTPLPTETPLPTDIPSPTPPGCAVPLNPVDNATIPATGPFDFMWTAFASAASYVVSIGPADWYPTDFPVSGTTLTRYMESFPSSPSYEWSITALDAAGQKLCTGGPYAFVTSKDLQATPSFSFGAVSGSEQTDSNSTVSSENSANISIATVDEYPCRLVVLILIKTDAIAVDASLLYGKDPQNLDHEQSLPSRFARDSLGFGRFELDIYEEFHAGETYYFWAKMKDRLGHFNESALVSHTMTCGQ